MTKPCVRLNSRESVIYIGDVSIQTVPAPRELSELLLKKANVTLPDAIPCRKVKVFTRKKLVEERRISL